MPHRRNKTHLERLCMVEAGCNTFALLMRRIKKVRVCFRLQDIYIGTNLKTAFQCRVSFPVVDSCFHKQLYTPPVFGLDGGHLQWQNLSGNRKSRTSAQRKSTNKKAVNKIVKSSFFSRNSYRAFLGRTQPVSNNGMHQETLR